MGEVDGIATFLKIAMSACVVGAGYYVVQMWRVSFGRLGGWMVGRAEMVGVGAVNVFCSAAVLVGFVVMWELWNI